MKDAIVLAGGIGSRIASVAGGLPKALLDVAERPFIEYVLDQLSDAGVERVIIAASYKWETIKAYLGSHYKNMLIEYSIEETPLGTGGAIKQAFELYLVKRAIVVNADTLFRIDLESLVAEHDAADAFISVALRQVPDMSRYGAVTLSGSTLTSFGEKNVSGPGLINGGIYVIDSEFWNTSKTPQSFSFERDVLESYTDLGMIDGFVKTGYFIDIGVPADLERARNEFKNH